MANQIDACPPAYSVVRDRDFSQAVASRKGSYWKSLEPGGSSLLLQFVGVVLRPIEEGREVVGYVEGCTYKDYYGGKDGNDVILRYVVADGRAVKVKLQDSIYWRATQNELGRRRYVCTEAGFQACSFTVLNSRDE